MRKMLFAVAALVLLWTPAYAQQVGDRVRLESTNPAGVPVHPAAGDPGFVRWVNGTTGVIAAIDSATGWLRIDSFGSTGWVTRRYITVIPAEDTDPSVETVEIPAYVIGTWNVEWLKDGKSRGFPENTFGNPGPSYGARTEQDYHDMADLIGTRLRASILVLTEINSEDDGTSAELDRLVGYLGQHWAYEIGTTGGDQRIAILFNTREARRDRCDELEVAPQRVQGKDIFDRDPLVCKFTLLTASGQPRNDLLVAGVHLASGQHLNRNHDAAMARLLDELRAAQAGGAFPAGEADVLIAGDFNASRYDSKQEDFWDDFDPGGFRFRTLAPEDGTEYPGTRLAGVPLMPRSQIDYLMASGRSGGLVDELVQLVAHVHTELLPENFNDFRRHFSDHLPVTVRVRVVADADP